MRCFLLGVSHMAISDKPLSPEMKQVIVTLKSYFDRNKEDLQGFASAQLTADATADISRVKSQDPQKRAFVEPKVRCKAIDIQRVEHSTTLAVSLWA